MATSRRLSRLARQVTSAADLPDGPLWVALSGGADSAALAWVAVHAGRNVRAVHVHHGLPTSDVMERAARTIARRLGIELVVEKVTVPPGASWEGQAREVRYAAFRRVVEPGEWLCTGHTRDDQAETVLYHLLRGSGLDGLAGIPRRRPPFARPFLAVSRSQTRELATLAGLPWRDDPTNREDTYLRSRIRHRVLRVLADAYGPGVVDGLVRTAEVASAELEVLEVAAGRIRIEQAPGRVRIPVGELRAAPPAVAARAVRRAWKLLRDHHPPGRDTVEAILDVAWGEKTRVDLPEGVVASKEGVHLVLAAGPPAPAPPPIPLAIPGLTVWGRWRFEVELTAQPDLVPFGRHRLVAPHRRDLTAVVRAARPGDRIGIGGGSKPVSEALAEAGIPPGERPGWPVVEIDGQVVWIPGVRRAGWRPEGGDGYFSAVAFEESEWRTSAP